MHRRLHSLSAGIVMAMCAGLLLPALIGVMILTNLRQTEMDKDVADHLEDKISLLVIGLADPVWNLDAKAASTIAEALLNDQQVVRITVSDPKRAPFLNVERAQRRLGTSHVVQRALQMNDAVVGHVELEIDDHLHRREFERTRLGYSLVLLGQFVLALTLILLAVRRSVLKPLARLSAFSNQLANGDLDRPLDWSQPDEIGRLARQLEHMRRSLRTSFAEQQAILGNVQVGVIFVRERTIELANRHAERIFGYGPDEMCGLSSNILYLSEEQYTSVGQRAYAAIATGAGTYEEELRLRHRINGPFWAQMRGCALDSSATQAGSIWVFEDVTQRRQASDQLRLWATVFENTADGVIITDRKQRVVAVNSSFQRITGYSDTDIVGRTPALLNSGRQGPEFYADMWRCLTEHRHWHGEIWNRRKGGEVYPEYLAITAVFNAAGELEHYVGVFSDISFRKAAQDEIMQLAFYDPLTQLPNRRLMLDRLAQALSSSARHQWHGALMMIDIDNFKQLNDTLGHDVGDQLLVGMAQRLQACVREGDTVARLGGDEFVVILENLDPTGLAAMQAESVAQKILAVLSEPYLLELNSGGDQHAQRSHHCTSSLGIALFRGEPVTVDQLMRRADAAMYQAKAAGRNTLRFFDPEMQAVATARASLEVDLRRAITEQQCLLYYQAQVDALGQPIGAEVLLRWQHPQRNLVSPAQFIPLAEETGLILPLGQWVLATACQQLTIWATRQATAHLTLAVNVSARQLRHEDFVTQVLATLERTGANPHRLKLELTESLLVDDVEGTIKKMTTLKQQGVGFSLDDFGTGYSSLSYLKRLPLDQLKIDQSFVRDVLTDPNDAAIARTIVALGKSLGLAVIAEGVETAAQRDFLARNGCLAYQGYFFNRPMTLEQFEAYLRGYDTAAQQQGLMAAISQSPPG